MRAYSDPKREHDQHALPDVEIWHHRIMTADQKQSIVELVWDYLKHDPDHKDRRQTGWGTKTKEGLCACIDRIAEGDLPNGQNC